MKHIYAQVNTKYSNFQSKEKGKKTPINERQKREQCNACDSKILG